ncbi:hypothetical protein [Lysinibacillus sphaericus]|nr:hypothetical protein [Lysinibacillus sphaericus]
MNSYVPSNKTVNIVLQIKVTLIKYGEETSIPKGNVGDGDPGKV